MAETHSSPSGRLRAVCGAMKTLSENTLMWEQSLWGVHPTVVPARLGLKRVEPKYQTPKTKIQTPSVIPSASVEPKRSWFLRIGVFFGFWILAFGV